MVEDVTLPQEVTSSTAPPVPDGGPSVRVRPDPCCYQHITAVSPEPHVE